MLHYQGDLQTFLMERLLLSEQLLTVNLASCVAHRTEQTRQENHLSRLLYSLPNWSLLALEVLFSPGSNCVH